MPAIKVWLDSATAQLIDVGIPSPRLDCELILAHCMEKPRTFLHAHPEHQLTTQVLHLANNNLKLRLQRNPVAYITGIKEFYGRDFIVTPDTLIPRPESEDIISMLKNHMPGNTPLNLVDVGTGCGCLGITAKLEFPDISVTLIDMTPTALLVASKNAEKYLANVSVLKSNLLDKFSGYVDVIIANLPYVNPDWDRSPETDFEPTSALFSDDNGMSDIKRLIDQSKQALNNGGLLILESDPEQHPALIQYAKSAGFNHIDTQNYITAFAKSQNNN
ncbi:peptide chain release factor N(5)-glutamine methyltransferase [Candidatus Saccharibacteria bacterium]|nr:peptide chain release factor N(5)-glutamine methyltransferase [Candidatus Saccharibacteria bacterium]